MKDLIPLLTTIVAVAGTLGGVFINNINTKRRDMNKFKREILEEIFKTANEIYYVLLKDDVVFRRGYFLIPILTNKKDEKSLDEAGALRKNLYEIQSKLKDDFVQLEAKFDMLVSFYFKELVLSSHDFILECQYFLEERYEESTPGGFEREIPVRVNRKDLLNKKNVFLANVKAEVEKNVKGK
ncbi:hypothetical protein [Peribacillus frigoritolerans]|uniref:hypothetical protein n=1 Tax=Peribacillus frigoritolerans TaxID=450367 RepID=UPI003F7F1F48